MSSSENEWSEIKDASISVPTHVVFRDLAHETVLLNITTGQYHGIDAIGARFFAAMRDSANLQEAAKTMAVEFSQPLDRIEADLAAFGAQMVSLGLIELHTPS